MTITVAWLRNISGVRELIVAADSRLTGGYCWDACPKLLPLPRGDCVLSFAGDTGFAYPVMLQIASAVRMYPKARDRSQDLFEFKGKVLEIINEMRGHIHSAVAAEAAPGEEKTFLLLAGYSWREADFVIWTLHFDASIDRFTFRPTSPWQGIDGERVLAVAGDAIPEFKRRLIHRLRTKDKLESGGFDMEPFEVLRDVIREAIDPSIGGPPQMVKVYRHMNVTPFALYWPSAASGKKTVLGRTLLHYELAPTGILDPDSLTIAEPPTNA